MEFNDRRKGLAQYGGGYYKQKGEAPPSAAPTLGRRSSEAPSTRPGAAVRGADPLASKQSTTPRSAAASKPDPFRRQGPSSPPPAATPAKPPQRPWGPPPNVRAAKH